MILWEGSKMTLIGAVIGFTLGLPLPKVFAAMFFDLHLGEPRFYLVVPGAIFLVALLATYIPARRATRVGSHERIAPGITRSDSNRTR
jgi:ABC-type lipoprotein release transport system permease subunit